MNITKIFKKAMSFVTASAMLFGITATIPKNETFAAGTCVVDISKTYQNIRGFGGIDLPEWQGYSLSDSELKYAFGNGPGELGLTVLRVFVNPDKNQWNKTLKTAQYATKAGATLFATPWEPPSNLAENGSGGARGGKKHLPKSNYGAYAQHLNDFAAYMEKNGAPLYSVSVQNEPDYASEWTAWSTDETTDFIANYGDKITNTKLMSPESFQYGAWNDGKDYYSKILKNSKAMANCDVFGTHFYGTPREKMDFPDLENCGKEIWMTEVYVPGSDYQNANIWVGKDLQNKNDASAIKVAENIHNGLVVGNMSVYTWWYIKRYYSLIGEERSGIMSSSEAGKPTKRGYAMAQYSKWVRPGYRRTAATEQPNSGVLVSAYKGDNNKVVIVAINQGSDVTQEFSVSGQTLTNVDRYRTTSSENLAETKGMETNGGNFFAQLPANSVSTFVCTIAGDHGVDGSGADVAPGTTPIEPDSNGYYFHDTFENGVDDWEARGGSVEIKQSGRQPYAGTEALVVTNRESSWQGVQKSLPSNTFKSGESYSFSVISTFLDSDIDSQKLSLSLQYKDASGETAYAHIADVTAYKGEYVQLANPSYKLPDGSDFILYVETAEGTDNFYIDEAIVAKDGTKIDGPTPVEFTLGDIDSNGVINAVDVAMARKIVLGGTADAAAKKAADVNKDGEVNIADAVLLQKFVLADISDFKASANTTPDNNTGNTGNTENTGSSAVMRSMSEYTPIVQAAVVESEPSEANQTKNGVEYGTLEKKSYFSDFCGREKKYNVLLPAGYTTSKKYPVLYVLHGYWEDQDRMILTGNGASSMTVKQVLGNAMAEGAAKDMIVVFPNVYSSQTQDACSGMDDANNIAYDNFETVLIKELMPLIEKNYSAATGRENTAITGFSMGGRESLNIGTKHPDLFGYVGAICPAPGATPVTKFSSEKNAPSLIFITAGGNDQTVYNIPEGYHNSLTSAGTPHIWHYYNAGYHGDNSIRAHLYNFVRAVFKA